jgi:HAD superfamily hydrolase (TIGR01509 family)
MRLVIFDIDGTLVDSTYHHALSWQRAFRACQVAMPMWRIHRQIGKGGDRLVGDLAGEQVERDRGDEIRTVQRERFLELIDEVQPLDGAHELLVACKESGWRVALASSGRPDEVARYLRLLEVEGVPDAVLSSEDVDTTKPAPDLLAIAHERAGAEVPPGAVLVVGDSVWDCHAARAAGMVPVGVLCGGFGREELLEADAEAVYATLPELQQAIPPA